MPNSNDAPLLKLDRLILHTPQGRRLNQPVSVSLPAGHCLVVSGPNGTGKSTLLRALLGLHRHYFGTVHSEVKAARIGYLPQLQNQSVHFPLTLADLVRFAEHPTSLANVEKLGLIDQKHLQLSWNSASGGERVRALLSLLLEEDPELLVLDEPFNHLDSASISVCTELIRNFLNESRTRAVVMVTHSIPDTASWKQIKKVDLTLEHLGD